MPIRVFYNNSEACTVRPTPLVSIGTNILKNGAGEAFGVTYSITLTGTILADQGMPFGFKTDGSLYPFVDNNTYGGQGPYGAFDFSISHDYQSANGGKPQRQLISDIQASNSIFSKQKALRALFSQDGQALEISDFNDDEATIICYPRLTDISFTEGIYVDRCDYTITLECDSLLNKSLLVDNEGTFVSSGNIIYAGRTERSLLEDLGAAYITDFSEDWSIEVDESVGESVFLPRSYRITHNINATGKTHYGPVGDEDPYNTKKISAWESARKFVQQKLSSNVTDYPNVFGKIGSGTIDLANAYRGYNHVRSEQLSESAGSYSVTETWLIASGTAYENYNMSISSSIDNPFISVSIDGNIKGLSEITPSGYGSQASSGTAYLNALKKYNDVTNSGQFGLTSDIFKRANNSVAVQLNSQPRSISLGSNEYIGELTYSLQFDNRPTNIISGVLAESISVNDTYPGDIFAVIPVIGRATGPVLQYVGGRSEYRRDLSINLTLDYTNIPYGQTRKTLLLQKPSVIEPTATQIGELISELSPAKEPGVRKYFISPPSETWNPKEGTYSLNISWTYELDK